MDSGEHDFETLSSIKLGIFWLTEGIMTLYINLLYCFIFVVTDLVPILLSPVAIAKKVYRQ